MFHAADRSQRDQGDQQGVLYQVLTVLAGQQVMDIYIRLQEQVIHSFGPHRLARRLARNRNQEPARSLEEHTLDKIGTPRCWQLNDSFGSWTDTFGSLGLNWNG